MPKAILELEMPESCIKCPCSWLMKDDIRICEVIMHYCPEEGRHKYCPLKLVEGCEYCNTDHNKFLTDDIFMATTNSYGDKSRVITSRHGLQYKTIRYCPMCGRRLEVEP